MFLVLKTCFVLYRTARVLLLHFLTHAGEINYLLPSIFDASKSRLHSRTPIADVFKVLHAVQKKGANDISWCMTSENEKYLADSSVLFMKGMQKIRTH